VYTDFYNLTSLPFRLNPDPEFFFGSQGHNRALSYLRYGLSQREGFIVVTGVPGTGKTTLARALLAEIGREKIVVGELNTTHLEAEDVLRMAAASFGLQHENLSKASILKRLEDFFLSKHRAGYHCLLLIDEAQNLPAESIEELRMLSNFYAGKYALLQIFMLGQQQFRDMLQAPELEQLRQRVVATTHLEPLNKDETKAYIIHRLKTAGWNEKPKLSSRALDMIFLLSKGVPRRINTFCDRLFLYASLEELYEIDSEAVRTVGKELMLETEGKARSAQIDSLDSVNGSQFEYAKSELTSAFDSSIFEGEEDSSPAGGRPLHIVNSGNTVPAYQMDSEVLSRPVVVDEDDADAALVALLIQMQQGQTAPLGGTLPDYMTRLLELAVGKTPLSGLANHCFQDNERESIADGVRQLFKEQLLEKNCDYFRRLAVFPDVDMAMLKKHYRLVFKLFREEQERDKQGWDSTYIRRINQAYAGLRDPEAREKYEDFLRGLGRLPQSDDEVDTAIVELPAEAESVREDTLAARPVVSSTSLPPVPKMEAAAEGESSGGFKKWSLIYVAIVLIVGVAAGVAVKMKPSLLDDLSQLLGREVSLDAAGLQAPAKVVEEMAVVEVVAPEPIEPIEPVTALPAAELEIAADEPDVTLMPISPPEELAKPVEPVETLAKKDEAVIEPPKKVQAPAKPKARRVRLSDVETVVEEFRAAYEAGNMRMFVPLFADDVRTNDRSGIEQVKEDYQALFSSTEFRRFELSNMKWTRKVGSASGKGQFKVSVVRSRNNAVKIYKGDIDIEMRSQQGGLKITNFSYYYE
jgi:putative secretion ATPase (PEP-CTERM system associated)